jgi:hypothetical protein
MQSVGAPPIVIGSQCYNAKNATNDIICKWAMKKRPMATIMLDDKHSYEQTGSWQGK